MPYASLVSLLLLNVMPTHDRSLVNAQEGRKAGTGMYLVLNKIILNWINMYTKSKFQS